MSELWAQRLVELAAVYCLLGTLFALAFVSVGVGRVDPAARSARWTFRALIFPGVVALWPLLLMRWLRGGEPPEERNAHRLAARR